MANHFATADLDYASVIKNFARQIETPENLNLLTLLTFADSQGTSDKLWNGFRFAVVAIIFPHHAVLTGGTEFVRASEKHRELLLD